MGFMQRFERSLETSTADAFARVFGGELTPLEVEKALRREAGDKLQELPDGQLLAPNYYVVTLSPADAERFANDEATSPRVISRHLDSYLFDQDWGVIGDVVIEFEESAELHSGQFRLVSECDDRVDSSDQHDNFGNHYGGINEHQPPQQPQSGVGALGQAGASNPGAAASGSVEHNDYTVATLIDHDSGTRLFVLNPGETLIGRGDDVDFRIPDTGVSRHHATITWNGSTATLSDLKSTNGTAVNDIRISQWQLADGDVITMGHTRLTLRISH